MEDQVFGEKLRGACADAGTADGKPDVSPRPATAVDLDAVADLYEQARAFMRSHGNTVQWTGEYPGRADAEADLASGHLWVVDAAGAGLCAPGAPDAERPVAVMTVLPGPDPTYEPIDGAWLSDAPYTVMHRIAVGPAGLGLGRRMLCWLAERYGNVRADTHESNLPMQRALAGTGFSRCGTIRLADGSPRIAYQHLPEA